MRRPSDPPTCPLDEIIVSPVPGTSRAGQSLEREALLRLSQALARQPDAAVQRLVESAMRLTGAGSAGVSLEDEEAGQPVFRWIAIAGELERYRHGTMPRDFSPCGTVVDRGQALVMREPVRHFAYIRELHAPVSTVLLVPFGRGGRFVGTVWVVAHTPEHQFSSEDLRVVQNLTTFATALLDSAPVRGPA